MFFNILKCSEPFSWVQRSSKGFPNGQRCFLMWKIFLRHSYAFSYFSKVHVGLRRSVTFWGGLRQCEPFSWVLSCYERLLNIQKCHLTLRSNLKPSCKFWKVHLRFLGFLWHSGEFWHILKCSNRVWVIWKISVRFEASYEVLEECSQGSSDVLKYSWMLWGIITRFCVFWGVLWQSGMFCRVLMRSLGLRRSLTSWMIWDLLRHFNEFWMPSKSLWYVLVGFEWFWRMPVRFEEFSVVLGVFWGVPIRSDRFWTVLKNFWRFCCVL